MLKRNFRRSRKKIHATCLKAIRLMKNSFYENTEGQIKVPTDIGTSQQLIF
jgi:hypothetical protein